jgi:hypothetical protein
MALSLVESQALSEIAAHLYPFLPGKAHPFADQATSFEGAARHLGLARYWSGGSKLPALMGLLSGVLEYERGRFCPLIVEIVRAGVRYRQGKGPVTREEVERLNELVIKVKFKIPELHDSTFLDALPRVELSKEGSVPARRSSRGSRKGLLRLLSYRLKNVVFSLRSFSANCLKHMTWLPGLRFGLSVSRLMGVSNFKVKPILWRRDGRPSEWPRRSCWCFLVRSAAKPSGRMDCSSAYQDLPIKDLRGLLEGSLRTSFAWTGWTCITSCMAGSTFA